MEEEFEEFEEHPQDVMEQYQTIRMTTTIDTNQWCGQFKRCNGCKLQSEYMVKPEEMFPVMEDGKYVDKWAIRTTAMIARELGKQNNKAA